jgi:hypothetical protein
MREKIEEALAKIRPMLARDGGDVELVEKAIQSKGGARFRQLWTGDASAYPSRSEADFALAGRPDDLSRYTPVFEQMFRDTNLNVRVSGMKMLWRLRKPIPREQLLQFFRLPDMEAISLVLAQSRNKNGSGMPDFINDGTGISDTEAVPLLQNSEQIARLIGLRVLYQNAEGQSVELALPLLKDAEQAVRMRAGATLRALTGQHFTEDQTDEWVKWWTANKTNFVVELHPEEFRPRWSATNRPPWLMTNRPPPSALPENFPR